MYFHQRVTLELNPKVKNVLTTIYSFWNTSKDEGLILAHHVKENLHLDARSHELIMHFGPTETRNSLQISRNKKGVLVTIKTIEPSMALQIKFDIEILYRYYQPNILFIDYKKKVESCLPFPFAYFHLWMQKSQQEADTYALLSHEAERIAKLFGGAKTV
jgi:hypothetical protein